MNKTILPLVSDKDLKRVTGLNFDQSFDKIIFSDLGDYERASLKLTIKDREVYIGQYQGKGLFDSMTDLQILEAVYDSKEVEQKVGGWRYYNPGFALFAKSAESNMYGLHIEEHDDEQYIICAALHKEDDVPAVFVYPTEELAKADLSIFQND